MGSCLGHRSEPGLSSPCEQITVWCPCGSIYNDWYRASINLSLDHFDDEYVERISSTTCPKCGLKTRLSMLLSQFETTVFLPPLAASSTHVCRATAGRRPERRKPWSVPRLRGPQAAPGSYPSCARRISVLGRAKKPGVRYQELSGGRLCD